MVKNHQKKRANNKLRKAYATLIRQRASFSKIAPTNSYARDQQWTVKCAEGIKNVYRESILLAHKHMKRDSTSSMKEECKLKQHGNTLFRLD